MNWLSVPLPRPGSLRLDLESALIGVLADDLRLTAEGLLGSVDQAAGEALVRPDFPDVRVVEAGPRQPVPGPIAAAAVRTVCASINPALGSMLRSSAWRTWPRRASWIRSTAPSSCRQVKYPYTVGQGVKSLGN